MTEPDSPNEGALFIPLPDGTALLYNLIGVAHPPKSEEVIETEVKAKVPSV
eukprot:CAMPEP_0201283508 /NCGR_PEP_ID=MMETSP1317-20130820/8739_1 /ASSEMBLY_ACC=CAM_ASM_000770 /TAXON_ID=187299 /ORGANISM="Undescribed Undescribed, Strain Undescribed" /LENGTH=50 /DNA_ID=CAMNT_0047599979 /DNA_START=733 /DNA_END=885 /DNA_ORIENTATION=-